MINAAHHWKIVFAGLREAVESGNNDHGRSLAEAAGRMVVARDGAETYETARAYLVARTKDSRIARGVATDKDEGAP